MDSWIWKTTDKR